MLRNKDLLRNIFFIGIAFTMSACSCDPDGKKECAWTLEAEAMHVERVQEGYVPVCARNRNTMKQDCRLQITRELAEQSVSKLFRYADMQVESVAIPRTIKEISYCGDAK